MLMNLAIVAALLLAVSALMLCWPRQMKAGQQLDRKSLFAEKLALLTDARELGELSEQDFAIAAAELKSQFLAPLPDAQQLQGHSTRSGWLAFGLLVVLTSAAYVLTGQYRELQHWQQAQDNLASFGERALLGKGEALNDKELAQFALALRTKLADTGDDAVAWFVLGRIWFSQGQVPESIEAFEKALSLTPERTNLLISYAQALLVEGSEENVKKAAQSLGVVLSKDAGNIDALSMLALIAQQRGDTKEARAAWEVLLAQLPKDDPRYAQVQQQLAQLELQPQVSQQQASQQNGETPDGPVLNVTLTIPQAVADANAGATLFVFARATEGMSLPVAVQKLTLKAGTMQIQLDNSHSMQSGWNLSAVKSVTVGARISRSGSATPDPTDLQLKSAELSLSATPQQVDLSF
ncbi:c-type cytochrome biogenesis protein CcmI [Rheinheimera texasensis]|uniref:c-type cytochrome biogenesis protein CcmI n=1 Tax=Rheinheimera texasensis TaxID=306205 RepID=UPI0004E2874F|nr:c-type cytochrome biogenesis protein CcmI [Rheinheimera texasensis]